MAELRSVDLRTLQSNPNNPRRTQVPAAMDKQLVASMKAVGIIQPPCVTPRTTGCRLSSAAAAAFSAKVATAQFTLSAARH